MHFYRALRPINAITFDLDDTLYDNREVIRLTLQKAHTCLQSYHPALNDFSYEDYDALREKLREQEPEIYHDVTEWRRRTVITTLLNVGLSAAEAEQGADTVMATFAQWRNRINITQQTHQVLTVLARRVPLLAITNGNADPHRFGLAHYFQFILRAGEHGRAKPYHDMYQLATKKLNLSPEHILHVGDDLTTDVAGSLGYGMQSCWINLYNNDLMSISDMRLLPHLEISQLASLTMLV